MKFSRLAFFDGTSPVADTNLRTLPESMLLIRYGKTAFTKGGIRGEFDFREEDADGVIREFASRGRDLVIDFEHQSLSGGKAPAAGWIGELYKNAEGLCAKVKYWTREAEKFLLNGEYRYFSPTLYFSRSGKNVSAIHSVALTNHPAMHMIPALAADDLDSAADDANREPQHTHNNLMKGKNMNGILQKLGLLSLADADQEEQQEAVLRKIDELNAAAEKVSTFLKLYDLKSLEEAESKLNELIASDAKEAVRAAFSDGKLTESMRQWAQDFAMNDLNAFQAWSDAAPRIVPDNKDTEEAPAREKEDAEELTPEENKIVRLLGLTEKQLKAMKKKKGTCK